MSHREMPVGAAAWSYAGPSGGITDTSADVVAAAPGAGLALYVTRLDVVNGDDNVGTAVILQDEDATVLWRGFCQFGGGGYAFAFSPPLQVTANKALQVVCGTTASATYVNAQGYTAAA